MARWNPFREMIEMQRTMDRMFDEVNRAVGGTGSSDWSSVGRWLTLDVNDKGDSYVVEADIPGINPDDIEVTMHQNTLTISGETKQVEAPEGTKNVLNERRYGAFRRSITLPSGINVDKAEAQYNNGVLTLTLPKSEESKPRQISVKNAHLLQHRN